MQLTGLRSVHLNIGHINASSERQQLLEQLAAQCTSLREVDLEYRAPIGFNGRVLISRAEMAAWALLPLRKLHFEELGFVDQQDVQLFPQLLAATHKHLTELHANSTSMEAVRRLPVGLVQLTGLRKLHVDIGLIPSSSERQQLLEQLAAQCTSLRGAGLEYGYNGEAKTSLKGGEMAAWALLPVCSLDLSQFAIPDRTDLLLFPDLLADTRNQLTRLKLFCADKDVAEFLPLSLAQLTGLRTLHANARWWLERSGVEQLFEVVGAQLVNLRCLKVVEMHVTNAAVQHLTAARSLEHVGLHVCEWDDGVDNKLESMFEEVILEWGDNLDALGDSDFFGDD